MEWCDGNGKNNVLFCKKKYFLFFIFVVVVVCYVIYLKNFGVGFFFFFFFFVGVGEVWGVLRIARNMVIHHCLSCSLPNVHVI